MANCDICADIVGRLRLDREGCLVAITGPDCSGKSTLADGLVAVVGRARRSVVVHADDFHREKKFRYAGEDEVENYLRRSIDFDALETKVLSPIRRHGRLRFSELLLDIPSDTYTRRVEFDVEPGMLVIVEGVFLLQSKLLNYWDQSIFVWAEPEVLVKRGIERDGILLGGDVERRYREKYLPAQARHLIEDEPLDYANLVIDNSDPIAPRIVSARPASFRLH